jgi:aspartate/methionine/tyrosine aminotransferase
MADRGIILITDETYQHFTYEGARHFSPASVPQIRSQVVTVGSFSKSFSMTGWRIGYLLAEPAFIEQALKIQDTMVICAPVIAQKAALAALRGDPQHLVHHRELLEQRRRLLLEELSDIPTLTWQPTRGSFFAFVRVKDCKDSTMMAMDILKHAHVATIPGSLFGKSGEGYLRLSYGSVEPKELKTACHRLADFFRTKG